MGLSAAAAEREVGLLLERQLLDLPEHAEAVSVDGPHTVFENESTRLLWVRYCGPVEAVRTSTFVEGVQRFLRECLHAKEDFVAKLLCERNVAALTTAVDADGSGSVSCSRQLATACASTLLPLLVCVCVWAIPCACCGSTCCLQLCACVGTWAPWCALRTCTGHSWRGAHHL